MKSPATGLTRGSLRHDRRGVEIVAPLGNESVVNLEDARHGQFDPLVRQAVPVEALKAHNRPGGGFM
jgi:hypothetical protein